MRELEIEICSKLGLHARASAKLVNTAASFSSHTEIEFAGQTADAKSIMAVMMLAASKGSVITIRSSGEDETQAVEALEALIEDYFGEDE